MRIAVLVTLMLSLISCASSDAVEGESIRLLDPAVAFDLPAGWNPNSIVMNQESLERDIKDGMSIEEAWAKNFVRSDIRGFFTSSRRWSELLARSPRLILRDGAAVDVTDPELEFVITATDDPDICRVEFAFSGATSEVGETTLLGGSDGAPSNASIAYGFGLARSDGTTVAQPGPSVLERLAGEPSVVARVWGCASEGRVRTWIVREEGAGKFTMRVKDVAMGSR